MTPEPSTQPAPDPDAPVVRHMSVEEFLTMCHNPKGLRPGLDKHLDEIQSRGDTDDRTMLRVCFWLLSNLGRSMPWDRLQGIDAKRLNPDTKLVSPSWRDCIAAILGVTYTEPEVDEDEPSQDENLEKLRELMDELKEGLAEGPKLLAAPPEDAPDEPVE